jgi:hypothetical protein
MNQQPPRQPQEPHYGQQQFGQPGWGQQVPQHRPSFYTQPTQQASGQFQQPPAGNFPPPRRPSGIWQWYTSRTKKVKLSIGCSAILALLLFSVCIGAAVASVNLAPPSAPTPTTQANQAAIPVSPTASAFPTATPSPTLTTTPTATPTPHLALAPTHTPQPTPPPPTPTPCPGVNCNPWGYNFTPGNLIYHPPSKFCTYFNCIASFWSGKGYVEECQDSTYSLSGGIPGSCSHHGGNLRPLYSH